MSPPPMMIEDRRGGTRLRGIGVGGFLLALVTVGALVHVAVRMKGIEVAYALGKERKLNAELEEQRRQLHIEIGMLKDPGRVVGLARDKLKMGPPLPGDIVRGPPPEAPAAAASAVVTTTATATMASVTATATARRGAHR
jgi:cell division protein FtsL